MDTFLLKAAMAPWGDYGRILVHGMSAHLPRLDGSIQLERTGPFLPPITFPASDVIVSTPMRAAILDAGLTGATFRPVTKARIASLDWEAWDRASKEPPFMPSSRAPEDYVLAVQHDPGAALALGSVWEVVAPAVGTGERELVGRRPRQYRTTISIPDDLAADLFRVGGLRQLFVSRAAREWLERHAGEWVSFEDVNRTSPRFGGDQDGS
jgi:hypothetical protein